TGRMQVSSDNHTEVESRAVYVQDQLRLNDQWQLLAGLRYDTFDIESTNKLRDISEDRDSHSTSPRVGLVWTPLQNHSFYASWTKTFSPVGGGLIGITPGAAGNSN
ncbi:TonB-dependent siderophore receptor, partial [Pseudomonas sp. GW247-3R2A]